MTFVNRLTKPSFLLWILKPCYNFVAYRRKYRCMVSNIGNNFDFFFDARQRWSQMNQCFAIPLTLIKVVVKYAGNFDFTFDARQRWSQKCSGCDHTFDTSQKWSQIRPLHFYNTFEWFQRWEQICSGLIIQTLMSKVILRKEIKKLYLNTVLKIFIR